MPLVYIPDNVYPSYAGAPSYHQPRFGFSQPQPSLSPFAFHRNEPSAAFPSAYDHDYLHGRSLPFATHTATVPQPFLYDTDPLELHKHQLLAEFARKLDHAYPSLATSLSSSSHSAAVATAAARQRYLQQQQHQEQEQQDLEEARRAATTHARAIEEAEQLCAQVALVERLREKQLLRRRMVERQRVAALAEQQAERERERERQQMMLEKKRQITRLQQQEQAGQQIECSQQRQRIQQRQQFPAALLQVLQPQQQLRCQPAQSCQQKTERLPTPRPTESKHQQQSHAAEKDHENDENELADALQTIFKLFTTDYEEKEEKPLPKSHFIPHPSARANSPVSASAPTLPKAIDTAARPASPTVSTGSRSSSPSRTPLLPSALTQLRRLQARATEVLDAADSKPSLKIEQLTNLLIEADAIESHEDPIVKKERKSFVVRVEKALEELEGVPAPAVAPEAETKADASSVPVEESKEEVVVTPVELAQVELPVTEESPTVVVAFTTTEPIGESPATEEKSAANPAPVDIPAEEAAPVAPADETTTSSPAIEESVPTIAVDPTPTTTAAEDDGEEVLIPISSPPSTPASLFGPSPTTTLALAAFDSVLSDHSSEASDLEDVDQQPSSSSRRSSSSSRRSHRVTVRDEAEEENEFTFV